MFQPRVGRRTRDRRARRGQRRTPGARLGGVNPDVDPKTHPYISTGLRSNKFGVAYDETLPLYRRAAAMPHIDVVGIDCHIGSRIGEIAPFLEAADRLLDLVDALGNEGIVLSHVDFGGGLDIRYRDETPPAAIADLFRRKMRDSLGDAAVAEDDERLPLEGLLPSPDAGPEGLYARNLLLDEIETAIDELPTDQSEVFVAHELEGRSFKEMAAETGVSVNTLLSRKRYAVLRLRKRLQGVYDDLAKG